MRTVQTVRASSNPRLKIQGIVLTMYDRRNNLSGQVAADVRENLGTLVYDTVIPRNVRAQRGAVARGAGADLRPVAAAAASPTSGSPARCWRGWAPRAAAGDGVSGGAGHGHARVSAAGCRRCSPMSRRRGGAARRRPSGAARGRASRSSRIRRNPEPAAPRLRRGGDRGARRLDPREGRDPAADPAAAPEVAGRTRSSPASAAGARRRWPACTSCPAVVRELTDAEVLEIAIIENIQRADLNAARGGAGLPPADGPLRPHPGAARRGARQEPQPHRQPAAAPRRCRSRCSTWSAPAA